MKLISKIKAKLLEISEYGTSLEKINNRIDEAQNSLNKDIELIENKIDILISQQISNDEKSLYFSELLIKKVDDVNNNIEYVNKEVESNLKDESILSGIAVLESKVNNVTKNNTVNNNIKILFLVNNINAWYALSSVIDEMKKNNIFEVIIASIHKKFPGELTYSGESSVHEFFVEKKIEHIRLGMDDSYQALDIILAINPNVIFRQSQWDADYPPALSSKALSFTNLALIPYEIANIVKNVNHVGDIADSAVDSLFHRRCWRVYCSNDHVLSKAKKNGSMLARQFRVVGHPKIDYLLNLKPKWPFRNSNAKKILWSPHHSIDSGWTDFGLFPKIWEYMLMLLSNHPEIDFVFCPHPALITQLESGVNVSEKFDFKRFIADWEEKNNGFVYFGADYADTLACSDVIITDGISMLIEGQILGKEIIFIERQDHVDFNELGLALKSGLHIIDESDDLESILLKLIRKEIGSLTENQIYNINKLFPHRNSYINIVNDIKSYFLN